MPTDIIKKIWKVTGHRSTLDNEQAIETAHYYDTEAGAEQHADSLDRKNCVVTTAYMFVGKKPQQQTDIAEIIGNLNLILTRLQQMYRYNVDLRQYAEDDSVFSEVIKKLIVEIKWLNGYIEQLKKDFEDAQ